MSKKVELQATKRTVTGKQVKQLRRAGQLPGVIYGSHMEPIAISMEAHSAGLTLPRLTSSSIATIKVDGQEYQVLLRDKQLNYIKGTLLHVDFMAVSAGEKLRAKVAITLHGVAPAVKEFNAIVVTNLTEIEVEALPKDLPERFDVDISVLKEIGDAIHVRDLVVPAGVEIHHDLDDSIALTTGVAAEEVEETETAESEPELIGKDKDEEESDEE